MKIVEGFIIILAHMASVLEIFKVSAWYLVYMKGRKKLEEVEEEKEEAKE